MDLKTTERHKQKINKNSVETTLKTLQSLIECCVLHYLTFNHIIDYILLPRASKFCKTGLQT